MFLAYDPATNPLNNNEWAFPLAECIHITGFAVAIGTIVILDLRMMGVALTRLPMKQLAKTLSPWTLIGLVAVLTSGPVIFTTDPVMYVYNYGFRYKMTMLALALLFNYTIHRKVAMADSPSSSARVVAILSIALWISVVFGGIFIAFV